MSRIAKRNSIVPGANVVNVNNTIGNLSTPSPTFQQVTAVADMRQCQLGVRWSF